ncbi:N-acetylglucosamine kinase [Gluconobacter cerinus]|uniref:N-acetylglucosamine kinase n=1 Tax=Gluconobacter cerinus TaxID=38307 RepID=UPI001C053E15
MTCSSIAAIDGGGTKTLLVVLHRDGALGPIIRAPGSNPFDQVDWQSILISLMSRLPSTTKTLSLGLAGYGEMRPSGRKQKDVVAANFPHIFNITNDVDIACTGAFAGHGGVLLLAGTGSVAWVVNGKGEQDRVGGWGGLFGDEGSAFWIGRQALSLLATLLDGRNQKDRTLLEPFADVLGLSSNAHPYDAGLMEWYSRLENPRASVASLAKTVSDMAEQGIIPAQRIMVEAATLLGAHITAARRKFSDTSLPWSYAGGALQSRLLRETLAAHHGDPLVPRLPPVGGALLNAAQMAGWNPDERWICKTAETLRLAGISS